MKTLVPFILVFLLQSSAVIAQTPLKVAKATVTFRIKNAGLTVNGSFGGFQSNLVFDASTLTKSQLTASVEANSVNTGIALRDNHIRKPEFFDVTSYPRITLKSTAIEARGGNAFTGVFDLTLKGKTRSVAIPFTFTNGLLSGSFVIDRRDFGVGKNSLIMGDDVTITLLVQTLPATTVADR